MVYVLLANGFEEIEALGFVDILRRAEIDVLTVSIYDDNIVTGSHDIPVIADICISDIVKDDISAVVLPGGMPGTLNLLESNLVVALVNFAFDNNKFIGAICAAPMVFGKLGLLKGKKATCYPGFEKELIDSHSINERVVKDGNVITSKGAGTVQDFAQCFITVLKDEETAKKIISSMQY